MPSHFEALSTIAVMAGLSLAACFPKSAPPPATITEADVTAAKAKWPDATDAQLASGRDIFIAKCNQCHDYPAMDAMTEAQWPSTAHRMAGKAKLDGSQERDVTRFILTARARTP